MRDGFTAKRNIQESYPEERSHKRLIEGTYLFSGDLTTEINTDTSSSRSDLIQTDYWTIQKQCYDIFKINPYAKRVIEMMTDFVIGTDITISVDEEVEKKHKVKAVINDFWCDYDNDMDNLLESMINEFWVLGEQLYPPSVNETTKIVKLGIIDARMVKLISRDKINQKRLSQVIMQEDIDYTAKQKVWGVINEVNGKLGVSDSQKVVTADQEYMGETFLFQVNRLPTQTRGYSELTTMLESLDTLDQFIFQVAEKSLLMYHFIADVLIKNKTEEQIKNFPVPNPKKNSVFKHSENVSMTLVSPDIKAVEADKLVRLITRFILAGVGIPEHWIVNGENTNLATAREQNNPIEKRLERKQGKIRHMLKMIIRYQLEKKGKYTRKDMCEIMKGVHPDLPSVAGIDRKLRAQVLVETAKSLIMATGQGWVEVADAGKEFINLANTFGMELSALHLNKKDQKGLSAVTGQEINNGKDLDNYFKQISKMMKQGFPKDIPAEAPTSV